MFDSLFEWVMNCCDCIKKKVDPDSENDSAETNSAGTVTSTPEESRLNSYYVTSAPKGDRLNSNTVISAPEEDRLTNNNIYNAIRYHSFKLNARSGAVSKTQNESMIMRDSLKQERQGDHIEKPEDEWIRVPEFITDQVTSVYEGQFTIKRGYTFDAPFFEISKLKTVKPEITISADWIRIKTKDCGVNVKKLSSLKIESMEPAFTKTVKGEISHVNEERCIINDDIYCDIKLCSCEVTLGEKVEATVVQSEQEEFLWRAISCVSDKVKPPKNRLYVKRGFISELRIRCTSNDSFIGFNGLKWDESGTVELFVPEKIVFQSVGSSEIIPITIYNRCNSEAKLQNVILVSHMKPLSLDPNSSAQTELPASLKDKEHFKLLVVCNGCEEGEFVVKVIVQVGKKLHMKLMTVVILKKPPVKLNSIRLNPYCKVIPGQRNETHKFQRRSLPLYLPTDHAKKNLSPDESSKLDSEVQRALRPGNYVKKFSFLLHTEELHLKVMYTEYTMESVLFVRDGEHLSFMVEGLYDKKPSVIPGDSILVTPMNSLRNGIKYQGYIHKILEKKALVKFNGSFHQHYAGVACVVEFQMNRMHMRRCHDAIRRASKNLGYDFFFPSENLRQPKIYKDKLDEWIRKMKYANKNLNAEQKCAVVHVTENIRSMLPYIIYGPPGTGKTVTLVECILQVYRKYPSSRILITTPSNSACDLLMQRILQWRIIEEEDMARILAYSRELRFMNEELQSYCFYGDDIEIAIQSRIVLCTTSMSSILTSTSIEANHFTHVFFDEAGQLSEPESCMPLSFIDKSHCQVVLVGDPKQLGPVIMSSVAKQYGLGKSLLQRLCDSVLYQPVHTTKDGESTVEYDERVMTKLVRNYRSHADIIEIPSRLFYTLSLIASCPEKEANSLLGFPKLPNKNFPIIFHGAAGENEKGNGYSWFNLEEAKIAAQYFHALLRFGLKKSDIGVITPYRKQVNQIRRAMKIFGPDDQIKIASVEEFQGQERKAIILSAVRSSRNLEAGVKGSLEVVKGSLGFVKGSLGFVTNAARFNVSITRAKYLLIVIGNPFVLQTDNNWNAFLTYCCENNAYVGVPLTRR